MKRIISLVLVLVSLLTLSVFCFTGCTINESEVSILWSGEGEAKVPDSLINSMERAMYIENVSYKHYGANGDAKKQVEQAKEVLNNGCSVLLVELVQDNIIETAITQQYAQDIVNAAKAKNVPVIFFNCVVTDAVLNDYDKCVLVKADDSTIADVQGTLIADYIKANYGKELDKNEDRKITFAAFGTSVISNMAIEKANELLATKDYQVSVGFFKKENVSIEFYDKENELKTLSPIGSGEILSSIMEKDANAVELIVTENDVVAFDLLLSLQKIDYNTDKLTTQFVPIVTVGNTVDYKEYVLSRRGELPSDLVKNDGDNSSVISQKNSKIKEHFKDYYYHNRFICDLTAVDEYDDMSEMIYTTINVIGDGRLVGTALADNDAISIAVAEITRNFIKGNDTFKNVAKQDKDKPATVIVEGSVAKVRYTSVSN